MNEPATHSRALRPRIASPSALLIVVSLLGGACRSGSTATADAARDCGGFVRIPDTDARAFQMGADGRATAIDVSCARPACLRVRDVAVVVVQDGGGAWASWEGRPGGMLEAPGPDDAMSPQERWARFEMNREMNRDTPRPTGTPSRPEEPPAGYSSSGEFRTCGNTFAGGGLGWHIIRNEGSVWQRIEWTRRPTDPAVLALAPNAYPLADATGALCGWAVQRESRNWEVHSTKTATVVRAKPDVEHPPARCVSKGAIAVQTETGGVLLRADGIVESVSSPVEPGAPAQISITGSTILAAPKDALVVQMSGGVTRTLALPSDRDLLKRPLPAGAVRERLAAAGDDDHMLLVNERIQMADCSVRESLMLLDVNTSRATLVAEGDVMFLKLARALERFWWVQTSPRLVDVSGDAPLR